MEVPLEEVRSHLGSFNGVGIDVHVGRRFKWYAVVKGHLMRISKAVMKSIPPNISREVIFRQIKTMLGTGVARQLRGS